MSSPRSDSSGACQTRVTWRKRVDEAWETLRAGPGVLRGEPGVAGFTPLSLLSPWHWDPGAGARGLTLDSAREIRGPPVLTRGGTHRPMLMLWSFDGLRQLAALDDIDVKHLTAFVWCESAELAVAAVARSEPHSVLGEESHDLLVWHVPSSVQGQGRPPVLLRPCARDCQNLRRATYALAARPVVPGDDDECLVAGGSDDGAVRVWALRAAPLASSDPRGRPGPSESSERVDMGVSVVLRHAHAAEKQTYVRSLAVSRDLVVSSSLDGLVLVSNWRAEPLRVLQEVPRLTGPYRVIVSPNNVLAWRDGLLIVTVRAGGEERTSWRCELRLWDAPDAVRPDDWREEGVLHAHWPRPLALAVLDGARALACTALQGPRETQLLLLDRRRDRRRRRRRLACAR